MAKEVAGQIKLQIEGGAADPSSPIGPTLGSEGINIMELCKQSNAETRDKAGKILPVATAYYADKSFDSAVRVPPAVIQLLEATKKESGSAQPNHAKTVEVAWEQAKAIVGDELVGLSYFTVESAMRMVTGTARGTGITARRASSGNN